MLPTSENDEFLLAAGISEFRQVLAILRANQDGPVPARRRARPLAVDLQIFCDARLENSLRCLICRGYVIHRLPRGGRRTSPPPSPACRDGTYPPRSRFSITPSGEAFARRLDTQLAALRLPAEVVTTTPAADPAATCAAPADSSRPIGSAARLRFDAGLRALYCGAAVLRQFRRSAHNQIAILAAFERANWPRRIADPLPRRGTTDPGERLRAAVHALNGGQRPAAIRFFCDGSGGGICWEFLPLAGVEASVILDVLSRKLSRLPGEAAPTEENVDGAGCGETLSP